MSEPDLALDVLKAIINEFRTFFASRGSVSEADARVKLIDRILVDVCGWPEGAITREEHVDSGFIDYSLAVQARRYVAVEAKREGVAFTFPEMPCKTLKLSGAVLTDASIKKAVNQVRNYCDDAGIR